MSTEIIKPSALPESIIGVMEKEIETSLLKLGVVTTISIKVDKTHNGSEYFSVSSTPFQTYPVLFKEVTIYGEGTIGKFKDHEDSLRIFFILDYRWKHFDGGSNGDKIGDMWFQLKKDFDSETTHPEWYIRKDRGLTI